MIEVMLAQVFIQAALLSLLLYFVARHEADYSFAKVAMVTAAATLGATVLQALLSPHIGAWAILAEVALIAFLLMTFCWISPWKSVLVVVIFSAIHIGFTLGARALVSRWFGDKPVLASPVTEEDYRLAIEFQQQVSSNLAAQVVTEAQARRPPPAEQVPEPPPPAAPHLSVAALETEAASRAETVWAEARKQLRISGTVIGQGGKSIAFVNGELVEPGSVVKIVHAGAVFRWRVRDVRKQGVDLDPLDVVPRR